MFQNVPLSIGRKRVFDSVFPRPQNTSYFRTSDSFPFAPPNANVVYSDKSRERAQKKEAQQQQQQLRDTEKWADQETWDRAWQTATEYLSLDNGSLRHDVMDDKLEDETILKRFAKEAPSQFVSDSIFYVGADASPGRELRIGLKECDLREWYMSGARRHFLENFKEWFIDVRFTRSGKGINWESGIF